MAQLWLALHLPSLSLESCAASRDAAQAQRPLALLHQHQVLHADALATACGIRPGMRRATALALAPDLLLGQADVRRDAQALRAVAHVALGFSPAVSWATPADLRAVSEFANARPCLSPALVGVRLEVQSCLRYFGGLPSLLQRLQAALAPLGHSVRIASAPTALGAALLAGWRDDLAQAALATAPDAAPDVAADAAPDVAHQAAHQAAAHDAAFQALLDAAPLALLPSARAHAEALAGMGLHTLADLRPLPRAGLARRFGPGLLADIDRARGHAPSAEAWLTLPEQFDSRIELLCRADTSAQVMAGAHILLARLMAWAGARQARVARFTLVMHHEPSRRHSRDYPDRTPLLIAPAEPSSDVAHLRSLLAERLGRLPLAAPALELSLQCQHTVAGAAPNRELFASRSSEREGLARLVERLQARLGAAQVMCLAPVQDYRPEHATRWQPADPARLGAAVVTGGSPRSGLAARSSSSSNSNPGGTVIPGKPRTTKADAQAAARATARAQQAPAQAKIVTPDTARLEAAGAGAGAHPDAGAAISVVKPSLPPGAAQRAFANAAGVTNAAVSAVTSAAASTEAQFQQQAQALSPQPLWLLPEPRALRLGAQGPLLDGKPLRLLAGPERLESGWWDEAGGLAVRDYYVAQSATGALVSVYCHRLPDDSVQGSGWFLQGLFG